MAGRPEVAATAILRGRYGTRQNAGAQAGGAVRPA